jgi:hypothetical protein
MGNARRAIHLKPGLHFTRAYVADDTWAVHFLYMGAMAAHRISTCRAKSGKFLHVKVGCGASG